MTTERQQFEGALKKLNRKGLHYAAALIVALGDVTKRRKSAQMEKSLRRAMDRRRANHLDRLCTWLVRHRYLTPKGERGPRTLRRFAEARNEARAR